MLYKIDYGAFFESLGQEKTEFRVQIWSIAINDYETNFSPEILLTTFYNAVKIYHLNSSFTYSQLNNKYTP